MFLGIDAEVAVLFSQDLRVFLRRIFLRVVFRRQNTRLSSDDMWIKKVYMLKIILASKGKTYEELLLDKCILQTFF